MDHHEWDKILTGLDLIGLRPKNVTQEDKGVVRVHSCKAGEFQVTAVEADGIYTFHLFPENDAIGGEFDTVEALLFAIRKTRGLC